MAKQIGRAHQRRIQQLGLLLIVVAVALLGVKLLQNSHAQSPYISGYAADGKLTSPASLVSGGSNSSSQAVQFGTASSGGGGGGTSSGGCNSSGTVAPCIGAATGTGSSGWGSPIFDDEFGNDSSLNTKYWTPYWYSNGNAQQPNCASTNSSNVSVSGGTLNLKLTSGNTCGLITSDPGEGGSTNTGFQFDPSAGKPVFTELYAYIPADSSGTIANWPALWQVGQPTWPENGEIDIMEGLGGSAQYHFHFGPPADEGSGSYGPGGSVNSSPGWHTYAAEWSTSSIMYYYDGKLVGTISTGVTDAPMHLVLENSGGSYGGPSVVPSTMNVKYVRVWQQ